MRRTLLLIVGWGFVILGLLGLVLPLLQGFLFLALGLYILSLEQPWVRRQRARLSQRYPRAAARVDAMEDKARDIYRRLTGGSGRAGHRGPGR